MIEPLIEDWWEANEPLERVEDRSPVCTARIAWRDGIDVDLLLRIFGGER